MATTTMLIWQSATAESFAVFPMRTWTNALNDFLIGLHPESNRLSNTQGNY
jgi:hypothetical protein